MGDMYRYRNATSKVKHVKFFDGFYLCVFFVRGGGSLPRLPRGRWLHPECRESRTGGVVIDATVSKHNIKTKDETIWTSSEGATVQNVRRQQGRRKMHQRILRDWKEVQE